MERISQVSHIRRVSPISIHIGKLSGDRLASMTNLPKILTQGRKTWIIRWIHTPEIGGSNPPPVIFQLIFTNSHAYYIHIFAYLYFKGNVGMVTLNKVSVLFLLSYLTSLRNVGKIGFETSFNLTEPLLPPWRFYSKGVNLSLLRLNEVK